MLEDDEIAVILNRVAASLTGEARLPGAFSTAKIFEDRVRSLLNDELSRIGTALAQFSDQDFPDIVAGDWGVEVKHIRDDKWRTVANSVFEGHRSADVDRVFLVVCKMGGTPEVRWDRYENCVVHVRTSHRPRYEVEIGVTATLFERMGVTYATFRKLEEREKMRHIRQYARGRLGAGEHLWWLGDDPEDDPHTLELAPRLYTSLSDAEKWQYRAEVAFLCPDIFKGSRARRKYDQAALYLMTVHGVLASQARDLFTAGSVAIPGNRERGGNYLLRSLKYLEPAILNIATTIQVSLIEEYWGFRPAETVEGRIKQWLQVADANASGWKPSEELFTQPS